MSSSFWTLQSAYLFRYNQMVFFHKFELFLIISVTAEHLVFIYSRRCGLGGVTLQRIPNSQSSFISMELLSWVKEIGHFVDLLMLRSLVNLVLFF